MSKTATVASMVRNAARSEEELVATIHSIFEDDDIERIADFFDRLNIPKAQGGEAVSAPMASLDGAATTKVWGWAEEGRIAVGIQRFLDRHERKVKWHVAHPETAGVDNLLLLVRSAMWLTNLRLRRLRVLFEKYEVLTPDEWATARDLMNRTFLTWRHFLLHMAGEWVDAMLTVTDRDDLAQRLGSYYELVDRQVRMVEENRNAFEDRRIDLTVTPEGFPAVKPPNYFGGDLLGRGPWKQYWTSLSQMAHRFRECAA